MLELDLSDEEINTLVEILIKNLRVRQELLDTYEANNSKMKVSESILAPTVTIRKRDKKGHFVKGGKK